MSTVADKIDCPSCDTKESVDTTIESERFPYGIEGPGQIWLSAEVPVRVCRNPGCGFRYTDHVGEQIREAAVREYRAGNR